MNKKIIYMVAAALVVSSFAGCTKEDTTTVANVTNVQVSSVYKGDIESSLTYTGDVKSSTAASVAPKSSGSVKAIMVEIGDYVTQGSTLMTLDATSYQLSYNQANAAYNSALAAYDNVKNGSNAQSAVSVNQSVASAQSNYDTALNNYNRQKSLYDIGAISRVALDAAKTSLDNAKLALDTAKESARINSTVISPQSEASAKAALEQAKAARDLAADSLANCTVKAPISGYIASKNVIIGQTVSQGMEVFSIKDSAKLEVEINVTEAVIGNVSVGTKAKINISSAMIENAEGIVTASSVSKNPATGMFTVKLSVPNDDGKIKDGMIAGVVLTTGRAENVLIIPKDSLITTGDEEYVYVAKDGIAVKKVITTGLSDENNVEVVSGLDEGEQVITEGKEFLSVKNNEIKIISDK